MGVLGDSSVSRWRERAYVRQESGDPWQFSNPRRDGATVPYTDADTGDLIDEAVGSLITFRCPLGQGDPGVTLSCLVSLIDEATSRLHDTLVEARDQGYSWDEIAHRIARSSLSTRYRYAGGTLRRRNPGPGHD